MLTIDELVEFCGATAVVVPDPGVEVTGCYTSDLLSDVMANAPEDCVLVTVQNHRNTVAVATLVGALVIMVCHDREIPEEMITAASNEWVAILKTPLNQYHTSARIYRAFGS